MYTNNNILSHAQEAHAQEALRAGHLHPEGSPEKMDAEELEKLLGEPARLSTLDRIQGLIGGLAPESRWDYAWAFEDAGPKCAAIRAALQVLGKDDPWGVREAAEACLQALEMGDRELRVDAAEMANRALDRASQARRATGESYETAYGLRIEAISAKEAREADEQISRILLEHDDAHCAVEVGRVAHFAAQGNGIGVILTELFGVSEELGFEFQSLW